MYCNFMSLIKLKPFLLRNSYLRINNSGIKIESGFEIIFIENTYKLSVFQLTIVIAESENLELATWKNLVYFG